MPLTSLYDWRVRQRILSVVPDPPFATLIMAAVIKADTDNLARLERAFPEIVAETKRRYHAPGGAITEEEVAVLQREMEAAAAAEEEADAPRT